MAAQPCTVRRRLTAPNMPSSANIIAPRLPATGAPPLLELAELLDDELELEDELELDDELELEDDELG